MGTGGNAIGGMEGQKRLSKGEKRASGEPIQSSEQLPQ
jgi:hypothetical protein